MGDYGLLLFIAGIAALVAAALLFAKSRSGSGSQKELEELQKTFDRLTETINTRLQSQTASLVETIGRVREESKTAIGQSFTETQKNLEQSLSLGRKEMDGKLGETQQLVNRKLEQLIKETAAIKSSSDTMLAVGKDIRQLSDILEGSKSRGGFGEFQLELLLSQAIPADKFSAQYQIGVGLVDAAILMKDRVLCIDSKFPLANLKKYHESGIDEGRDEKLLKAFHTDVKNRAREIAKSYIVPQKTLEFAIMFVPSEAVFLEIVGNPDLHKTLMDMNVVPASPNFLYVYFQALAIGFRGMAVEARAQEIIMTISELKMGFEKFQENFRLIGTHLQRAQNQFAESDKQAGKIAGSLEGLQMGKTESLPEE